MNSKTLKTYGGIAAVLAVLLGIFGIYEVHSLNVAHSTFENYYKFRGCTELVERSDTSATCRIPSGKVIKLVEINGRWYLDGDGPGIW